MGIIVVVIFTHDEKSLCRFGNERYFFLSIPVVMMNL